MIAEERDPVQIFEVKPEDLELARVATAPEVKAVEKRHAEAAARRRNQGDEGEQDPAHTDRGWLLEQVQLRDAQIRVLGKELERLRAREAEWAEAERAAVDEAARLRDLLRRVAARTALPVTSQGGEALSRCGLCGQPRCEANCPGPELQDYNVDPEPRPAGTLASLPADECDGAPRPGER